MKVGHEGAKLVRQLAGVERSGVHSSGNCFCRFLGNILGHLARPEVPQNAAIGGLCERHGTKQEGAPVTTRVRAFKT